MEWNEMEARASDQRCGRKSGKVREGRESVKDSEDKDRMRRGFALSPFFEPFVSLFWCGCRMHDAM